ncbi:MAG: GAF domain-containing protein [Chloroflexia bacterium]
MGGTKARSAGEIVLDQRAALDRLAMRTFYWLRLEGEARTLSRTLGRRIVECLDGLLQALEREDFAPLARFLAQEQERVAELGSEERVLQTVALLDACERTLVEAFTTDDHTVGTLLPLLHSLVHQGRRHWLHLLLSRPAPAAEEKAAGPIAALGRALNSATDLDTLVTLLFTNLQGLIPHEDGQLLLWGPRQETPLVRCANSRLFVGHGGAVDRYSSWVAFQRTPLLLTDLGAGPDRPETAYNSYIGVPLLQGDHLVGTLALVSTQANAFDQDDLDLLMALAPLLSAAIQRVVPEIGPLENLQRRLEEQNIILTFGREMSAALEEGRIYSLLLFKAMELTDSDAGAVLSVDARRQEYAIQALSGYATDVTAEDALLAERAINWNVGIVGWVARTGQSALIPDVREEPDYLAVRPETRSQLTVPIKWHGEVIGVLNLESSSLNAYTEEHLQTAETLAEHAAVAMATARLFAELQARRKWLAGLVANLPEGVIVTDEHLRVILSNPASAHFLGLEQPPPEGVPLDEHLAAELGPALQEPSALLRFLERTRTLERGLSEAWLELRQAGRRLWLVGAPLWEEEERPGGRVILIRDARQEEESEREKLGFITVVSHELRSPLTSILGYSELLLTREFRRDRRQSFIQAIFDQAQHLSRLVDDLISLSRLSRGKIKMYWSKATFYQVVAGLATQLQALMTERHSLLIDVSPELPPFYLDRDKVRVILNNLIGNAVKYSPDGGEVILRAEAILSPEQAGQVPTPPPCLLISVEDQGIGIPEEALPHIFDRFYRADNTATRQIGGTGLGLTIAKALVELHGGSIWAKSVLGQGSTFYFTLPLRDSPPEEETAQEEAGLSGRSEDEEKSPVC